MTHRSPYHMFVKSVRAALAIAVGATLAAPVGASAAPVAMGFGARFMFQETSTGTVPIWVWLLICFVVVPIMAIAVIPAMAGIMGVIKSPLWKRNTPAGRRGRSERDYPVTGSAAVSTGSTHPGREDAGLSIGTTTAMNVLGTFTRRPAGPLMVWLLVGGLTFLAAASKSMVMKVAAVALLVPIVLGLILLMAWRTIATATHVAAKLRTEPGGPGATMP